jgi:signal transduction histidine kinase
VLLANGTELGSGPPMAGEDDVERALAGEAFTLVDHEGGRVLVPVVTENGTAVVRSTVAEEDLRHGVVTAWSAIVALGLLLLGFALLLAVRLGRGISAPLLEVAGTAHRLREGDLAARAEVRGPEETQELARALNGLAERTGELLATERAAVADLSHRLRTPVTALRLDAEAVPDPDLANRLQEHIAVLQRTIDAIVREARRPVRTDLTPVCDAATAIRDRVEFWRPLAEDQGRPTTVALPTGPLWVPLERDDLVDLLDVLVDNVFAHTAEGTSLGIHLDLDPTEDAAVLTVTDGGPGFAAAPRPDRRGTSGLGLDIVRRTAESCGGRLRSGAAPEGGALVEVRLPVVEP